MFNRLGPTVLLALVLATLSAPSPAAAADPASRPRADRVVSKPVTIPVRNTNATRVLCAADGRSYQLRGRLVGSARAVDGRAGAVRMNVLVHDFATGGWFWHLRQQPRYDYATRLARRGELSLVLDRLGYGGSPLADGRRTCLGAQADMLHQVVQHVRSGTYEFAGTTRTDPVHAAHVVLHGHAVGAAIAQLEAGTFDDVDGLVLMSPSDTGGTRTAGVVGCLGGATSAAPDTDAWASGMFRTAPAAVRAAAVGRRGADPCGDVLSLGGALLATRLAARDVDAPVLLLAGERTPRPAYPADVAVTSRVVPGAGSALPLEQQGPDVRRTVLGWLRALR